MTPVPPLPVALAKGVPWKVTTVLVGATEVETCAQMFCPEIVDPETLTHCPCCRLVKMLDPLVAAPAVSVFEVKDHTCVLYNGSSNAQLECFCQCSDCKQSGEALSTQTPTLSTLEATKQKCNSGWGNGNEGCNPGNSTQKPHDEGTPKKK